MSDLAGDIVRLPDGTDFASGDVGSLFQGLCLGKSGVPRNPARYAEIFSDVAAHPGVSPWMHYAAKLEVVNGLRREEGAHLEGLANRLAGVIEEASLALPSSRDRDLLLGGAAYNLGILRRGLRQYADAAESQLQSVGYYALAGDRGKMFASLFVSDVETISDLFVDQADPTEAIDSLIACDQYAAKTLDVYPPWMHDNAPIHIAWAVMMNALYMGEFEAGLLKDEYVKDEFRSARGTKFPHWATLFQAWEEFLQKDYQAVIDRAPVELPSSSADNARLSLQILIADAEYELGRDEDAKRRLRAVKDHDGADGGVPIAVATAILDAWESAEDSDNGSEAE